MRLPVPLIALQIMASTTAIGQTPDRPAPLRFMEPQYALGPASATVTVVEYFSDTCPHCAAFDAAVFPYVRANYIDAGRIRYIFREALTPPAAISAAGFILARCAGQDKYLAVVEDIFKNQSKLTNHPKLTNETGAIKPDAGRDALLEIGRDAGLTDRQMQDCLSDDEAVTAFRDRIDAATAAGVEGTPTFVFNGRTLLPGERIGGSVYRGGELTKAQFDAAYFAAARAVDAVQP